MTEQERYLGDGLYASLAGDMIKLRAPRDEGDHVVYLETGVYRELVRFGREHGFPEPESRS